MKSTPCKNNGETWVKKEDDESKGFGTVEVKAGLVSRLGDWLWSSASVQSEDWRARVREGAE